MISKPSLDIFLAFFFFYYTKHLSPSGSCFFKNNFWTTKYLDMRFFKCVYLLNWHHLLKFCHHLMTPSWRNDVIKSDIYLRGPPPLPTFCHLHNFSPNLVSELPLRYQIKIWENFWATCQRRVFCRLGSK